MRKIYSCAILIFLTLVLSACTKDTIEYELTLDVPEILYVGDSHKLSPESNLVNDYFIYESSHKNILFIDTSGHMIAINPGQTTITVTNKTNHETYFMIEVLAIPAVESLKLEVIDQLDETYYVGKTYTVKQRFIPECTFESDVRYSYSASFMDFDDKTGTLKFHKAGQYQLTAYLASDWNIQTTLHFDVMYTSEYEAYNLLFIGNSLTRYTHNIPNFVYEMLRYDDVPVFMTVDSTTPQWIIDHEINFNHLITKDSFTHVFLQEQSAGPITDYAKFEDAVIKFNQKILENGGKAILYQTWGYNYANPNQRDEMTLELGKAYEKVAKKVETTISPVGYAFLYIVQNYPEINLYEDLNHPSLYGALLAAYTHYATLTNRLSSANGWVHPQIDEVMMSKLKEAADYVVFQSA